MKLRRKQTIQQEKPGKTEEKPEDWEFDFTQYEKEGTEVEQIETTKKQNPRITGLCSRFSLGQEMMEIIGKFRYESAKLAVEVESRTNKIQTLWKFYAILSETWEQTRTIYGSLLQEEVAELRRESKSLLENCSSGEIDPQVHVTLLKLRRTCYMIWQKSSLGFEVERINRGGFAKSERKIVE